MIRIDLLKSKVCTECMKVLPLTAFDRASPGLCGRASKCKDCKATKYYRTEKGRAPKREWARRMRLNSVYRQKMAEAERRPESKRKRKSRNVERVYGLTDEDLARLYEQQGRCCAVCRTPLHLGVETKIDHCHATGRVRGLLCHGCNIALGLMKDNPAAIRRLAEYADYDVRRPK